MVEKLQFKGSAPRPSASSATKGLSQRAFYIVIFDHFEITKWSLVHDEPGQDSPNAVIFWPKELTLAQRIAEAALFLSSNFCDQNLTFQSFDQNWSPTKNERKLSNNERHQINPEEA